MVTSGRKQKDGNFVLFRFKLVVYFVGFWIKFWLYFCLARQETKVMALMTSIPAPVIFISFTHLYVFHSIATSSNTFIWAKLFLVTHKAVFSCFQVFFFGFNGPIHVGFCFFVSVGPKPMNVKNNFVSQLVMNIHSVWDISLLNGR